ncbi:chemotaxis protein CheW [Acuticoccus sp.]|uniref:hybrid sensor histidine kinase/response regulator n=1 Tax=Acuticoccus sp. TaxID=1904378 RepID=UPI003B51DCCE
MDGHDELLSEFITDTQEALEQVDVRLVELEHASEPTGTLNELFRLMHTIKGTCGFLGLPRMAGLAHAAETLMDRLRTGAPVTNEAIDGVLRVVDLLKLLLDAIEASGGTEPHGSDEGIIASLDAAGTGGNGAASTEGEAITVAGVPRVDARAASEREARADASPSDASFPSTETIGSAASPCTASASAIKPATPIAEPTGEKAEGAEGAAGERSIRVSLDTLDHLMTVVSELVLSRNELNEIMRNEERIRHKLALQRLSSVTGELQRAVMSTRMQPIGNAWRKLPRVVRDVSASLGKQIELEMCGAQTELDRELLESIKDPLMHMVRNAADHGLEDPEERQAARKPAVGRITLNAYHEGGQILVEIADDGRGLDVERIKAKAIERGIATAEDTDGMSKEQIFSFIFEPGFSTAQRVTSLSGRGVGMDVVQSNIERVGGSIDVRSVPGRGSVFTLRIPLTLAILHALIVEVDDHHFAVPQTSVDELLRVAPGGPHSIQLIKDAPVLCSRGRLLPIIDLKEVLRLPTSLDAGGQRPVADASTEGFVMVMRARGLRFGLLVDAVLRTEEVVLKPLPIGLRNLELFSGCTILGDGRVIMIVDPNGVRSAAISAGEGTLSSTVAADAGAPVDDDRQPLLLFKAASGCRKALPVSLVTRLEDLCLADAEQSDGRWRMRYHDKLIPLVWFGEPSDPSSAERKPVLVMSDRERSMGLIVDEILDIVEDRVEVQIPSEQNGILGSAIIGGAHAEVVDVSYFLGRASPHWFDLHRRVRDGNDKVLIVDGSAFFRNLVAPVVRSAGLVPIACASGAEALERLERGLHPAVILTDVDTPEMGGFAFAKALRRISRLDSVPVVALTGTLTDDAVARACAEGFAGSISKLDRNGILECLRRCIKPASDGIAA